MVKHQKISPEFDTQRLAEEAIQTVDEFVQGVAARESNWVGAGLSCWSDEIRRYYSDLSKQTMQTIDKLKVCQTPFDVLKVEQEWWSARSRAYLESGVRFAQAFSDSAKRTNQAPNKRANAAN